MKSKIPGHPHGPGVILPSSSSCLHGLNRAKGDRLDCLRVYRSGIFPVLFQPQFNGIAPLKNRGSFVRHPAGRCPWEPPLLQACRIWWARARKSPALCLQIFSAAFSAMRWPAWFRSQSYVHSRPCTVSFQGVDRKAGQKRWGYRGGVSSRNRPSNDALA